MKKFYAFLFVPIFLLASLSLYAGRAGGSDPAAVECPAPAPEQISVSGVTSNAARLHSTITGVQSYYWRYSAIGSGIWMHMGGTAANFIDLQGLLPNTNYEYQVKVLCGNSEYGLWSASEYFTTGNAPSSCNDPIVMQCGVNYNGVNSGGTNTFDYYWGPAYEASGLTASEVVYRFTLSSPSDLTIDLTGLSANLDLILLNSCFNYSALSVGQNTGTANEQINIYSVPAGTYYIVVDGKNGAVSNYNLSVWCNNECATPSDGQYSAGGITTNSVRFTSTLSNVTGYEWRYRATGAVDWTQLGTAQTASVDLFGLSPGTTYEYQHRVRCANNVAGGWSATKTFTSNTACAPPGLNQLSVSNISTNAARLGTSITGQQGYDWRYRASGAPSWNTLANTANNFVDLAGLTANTVYEYQVQLRCADGMGGWSDVRTFKTLGAQQGCENPAIVQCGYSYFGNNAGGISVFGGYWGNGIDASNLGGKEVIHKLTLTTQTDVSITLSGLWADLDLFLLSACDNYKAIAQSRKSGTLGELIVAYNLAPGMYFIAVDAASGVSSEYNLSISCVEKCPAPEAGQVSAINITTTSARLSTTVAGVENYTWRYRVQGAQDWTTLAPTTANFVDLNGLTANTTYEYQLSVKCGGVGSEWSTAKTFKTPPLQNCCENPVVLWCGETYSGNNANGCGNFGLYPVGGVEAEMPGKEIIHQFTLNAPSSVVITLTGLTTDLDLILLSACDSKKGLALSGNAETTDEKITINLAAGVYYIAVDAPAAGLTSAYKLSIVCTPACPTPTAEQLNAINITVNSARLTTTLTGVDGYNWRYREQGAADWVALPTTTATFVDLTGLKSNTTYEYQLSVKCGSGAGAW